MNQAIDLSQHKGLVDLERGEHVNLYAVDRDGTRMRVLERDARKVKVGRHQHELSALMHNWVSQAHHAQ